ncbi:amino acid adenylation domain-containing protein, partial [Listeria monocytogenes]|nr:amino acid adenylation domain-containing protein [Listeria monocytogenes]
MKKDVIQDVYPLTNLQQGMLFHSLNNDNGMYYTSLKVDINKRINSKKLYKSLVEVYERYDVLRTVIDTTKIDEPLQVVLKEIYPKIDEYDYSESNMADVQSEIQKVLKEEKEKYFNFSEGPLFRTVIFNLEHSSIVVFIFHHIILDGWSISNVVSEIFNLYTGGESSKIEYQFKDYVYWEKKDDVISEHYWKNQIKKIENVTSVPSKLTNSHKESNLNKEQTFNFGFDVYEKLLELTRNKNCSMSDIFHAAWAICLYKYNKHEDISFGTVVSGRFSPIEGIEQIVGMTINTLPFCVHMKEKLYTHELLDLVKHTNLTMQEHSNISLVNLQKESILGSKLINHIFIFENIPSDFTFDSTTEYEDIEISNLIMDQQTNFDFNLFVIPLESSVRVRIEYNPCSFSDLSVTRILSHLEKSVLSIIDNEMIEDTSIISESEIEEYEKINKTEKDYEKGNLVSLFNNSLKHNLYKTAVKLKDQIVSYQDLDILSDNVAMYLIEKGYKVGDYIGVDATQVPNTVINMLGVLKAGLSFIPIDYDLPRERIAYIIKNSKCKEVLTPHNIPNKKGNKKIEKISNEQIAYVIYTSGSTGKPKGVKVSHGAAVNTLSSVTNLLAISNADHFIALSSFCFDLSIFDIFGCLSNGATLHLLSDNKDISEIVNNIEIEKITVWNSVPTTMEQMLENFSVKNSSLRKIILTGDVVPKGLPAKVHKVFEDAIIYAMGGNTEAAIWSTYYDVTNWLDKHGSVPYGVPLNNQKVLILDPNLYLCPINVPGELYFSGNSLSRGYLELEKENKEFFIKHKEFGRIYKTGDVAALTENNYVEYLGRSDNQVKINGFRIELEEIENVLIKMTGIEKIIVTVCRTPNPVLVAYICDKRFDILDWVRVETLIAEHLPLYMVPRHFEKIEEIPYSSNGKVDRKSLPVPKNKKIKNTVINDNSISSNNVDFIEIIGVFEDILGTKVEIEDNFFHLGGDSIKAIQISSKLKALGYKLVMNNLFKHPNLRNYENFIEKVDQQVEKSELQIFSGIIETSPIQNWFFDEIGMENHWNQSFALYRKEGFELNILIDCFNNIVQNHESIRTRVSYKNENISLEILEPSDEIFPVTEFDARNIQDLDLVINEINETQQSLSLTEGPLATGLLIKTKNGDHLILICHHLVIDGVSWRIIFDDLATLYDQHIQNNSIKIEHEYVPYSKWTSLLKRYSMSSGLLNEISYWNMIGQEINEQPLIKPVNNTVKSSLKKEFKLNIQDTNNLLNHVNSLYEGKLEDFLLGSLIFSMDSDNQVGIWKEGHGRENLNEIDTDIDLSRTIGWFTTQYPMIFTKKNSLTEQISEVSYRNKKVPNKGLGYGVLSYLTPEEHKFNFVETKQKNVCFNYLGDFENSLSTNIFENSPFSTGEMLSQDSKRPFLLDIVCYLKAGELNVELTGDGDYYDGDRMDQIMENLINDFSEKYTGENIFSVPNKEKILLQSRRQYDPFPLTDIQTSYYVGRNSGYEIGGVSTHSYTEIDTEINLEKFEIALNKVFKHHPMLRAVIVDGMQQVLETVPYYKVTTYDYSKEKNWKELLENQRDRMSHQVFDLECWPLFEISLIKIPEKKMLCISRDLITIDAASMDIFGRDVVSIYHNDNHVLKKNPYSFKDYVNDVAKLKDSEEYFDAKEYWYQKINHLELPSELPLAEDPMKIGKPHFSRIETIFDKEKWYTIKEKCRNHGISPTTFFLGVYAKLLSTYSNDPNVGINMTLYNRVPLNEHVSELIGDFTSNLLFFTKIKPNETDEDFFARIQDELFDDLENRSFEGVDVSRLLIEEFRLNPRKANMPYIFTSILGDEKVDQIGWENFGDIKTGITQTSQVYIDFQLTIINEELWMFWDYVDNIFDQSLIHVMYKSLLKIIDSVIFKNDQSFDGDIQLNQVDKSNEMNFNNLTNKLYEQVVETPEAIAVKHNGVKYTYDMLN